jgi:hypothetical protein
LSPQTHRFLLLLTTICRKHACACANASSSSCGWQIPPSPSPEEIRLYYALLVWLCIDRLCNLFWSLFLESWGLFGSLICGSRHRSWFSCCSACPRWNLVCSCFP